MNADAQNPADLVDLLRDSGDRAAFEPHLHHAAADEITRLRAAVAEAETRGYRRAAGTGWPRPLPWLAWPKGP